MLMSKNLEVDRAYAAWLRMGGALTPWQRLYLIPEPQGQGEFLPISGRGADFVSQVVDLVGVAGWDWAALL